MLPRWMLFFIVAPSVVLSFQVKIGIVSGPEDDPRQNTDRFWTMAQTNPLLVSLQPTVRVTRWWGAVQVARAACSLVQSGTNSLMSLGPPRLNPLLAAYSNHTGLPLLTALDTEDHPGAYQSSLLPDTSQAAADLISQLSWDSFAFIYDADHGAGQLQKILRKMDSVPQIEAFWKASDAEQAARFIQLLPRGPRRIVLATSERLADELPFESLGTTHFILLRPVGTVRPRSSKGFCRLTKFSVIEPNAMLTELENRLKTLAPYMRPRMKDKEVPDSVVLSHDASRIFYNMFYRIARDEPSILNSPNIQDCLNFNGPRPSPQAFFQKVSEIGVTGKIEFDSEGQRSAFSLNILEQRRNSLIRVGTWTREYGLNMSENYNGQVQVPTVAAYTAEPPIRVTSVIVEPYLSVKDDGTFYGYVVDLVDEISTLLGRPCQLNLVKDKRYGTFRDGQWNGMVGELVRGEADLAVAPLTKTREREEAVDFSKYFMTVGLNVLMKKHPGEGVTPTFGPFAFLSIWSAGTWVSILLAAAAFSGACYAISRFIGSPDRVRALESKGTDNLSPCGSVWFTIGSLLFRDTGIYPRNLSHRLWSVLWWGFCFFLLAMYVSSLTAALIQNRTTVTTIHSRKTSQEVLQDFLQKGTPAIGTVRSGSTMAFFLGSEIGLYRDFGRSLQDNPDLMTDSYNEGAQRVRNSNGTYAYIMESSSSELFANTPPCDLLVSSGFLVSRSYGIGLQKNSPLKESIDHAILKLMETGTLRRLYEKWWHNLSTPCEDPILDILPKVYSSSMTLYEVSGVFYLLIVFLVISVAAAGIEHYVRTRRITME